MALITIFPFSLHLIKLILICLQLLSPTSQTDVKIALGSYITAGDESTPSSWPSSSGEFTIGFQETEPGKYLLAIWFNMIPDKTVVWSAKGKKAAKAGSKVQLTLDGQFVLRDPQGRNIWKPKMNSTGLVDNAALLDTGNFVLESKKGIILWQSFHHPSDTILPGQVLRKGSALVARYNERSYLTGRYQLRMQSDGNLVLYTMDSPNNVPTSAYWASETSRSGFQVVFNTSGRIYVTAENRSIIRSVISNVVSAEEFYQRAVLEYDGIFTHYLYPKINYSAKWSSISSVPSNICLRIRPNTGIGACGYNSYCILEDDGRSNCVCPPGYSFVDQEHKIKGCRKNFMPQACGGSQDEGSFSLVNMPNTDFDKADYEVHRQVSEDWCKQDCLTDCFCDAIMFGNGICYKKSIPLRNGKQHSSIHGNVQIKVRKNSSDTTKNTPEFQTSENNRSMFILILSLVLSNSVSLILLLVVALFIISHSNSTRKKQIQLNLQSQGMVLRSFSYKELEKATSKFQEEVGRGASSTVYKGVVTSGSIKFVAVKKLDGRLLQGKDEFEAEMRVIAKTNHRNLTQLIGFCMEEAHRILVYEYMSNGSLANYLFGKTKPPWHERRQLAPEIARGLAYLHEECSNQIMHCDVKPQNILLNESLMPKISDFGLAKLLNTDQTRTMTAIRGTRGYVAPEWFRNMPVTVKVDVYSFGMVLLELICCRRSFEEGAEDERMVTLPDWVYYCHEHHCFKLLVQNEEEAMKDIERVERFVVIGLWCIQEEPSMRPPMKRVLQMLEGVLEVPSLHLPLKHYNH